MAGVAEENRGRLAGILCVGGLLFVLLGVFLMLQHQYRHYESAAAGPGPASRQKATARMLQAVLFWLLVLIGIFAICTWLSSAGADDSASCFWLAPVRRHRRMTSGRCTGCRKRRSTESRTAPGAAEGEARLSAADPEFSWPLSQRCRYYAERTGRNPAIGVCWRDGLCRRCRHESCLPIGPVDLFNRPSRWAPYAIMSILMAIALVTCIALPAVVVLVARQGDVSGMEILAIAGLLVGVLWPPRPADHRYHSSTARSTRLLRR